MQPSCKNLLKSQPNPIAILAATFLLASSASNANERPDAGANFKDQQAIQALHSGETDTANAAWWGFDPVDSTEAIQSAIDSGAAKVVIPYMGADWIVEPITLANDQEILFEPGVVVTAKQGAFKGERDALFMAVDRRNVKLIGYGAVLRMRKADYATSQYPHSEWRHVLALHGAKDFHVAGLTLQSSGGDGIYVGPTWDARRIPCEDVLIEDCVCNDNLRQGISIVSGRNILLDNCTFRNTRGTSPESGVDVEPSSERDMVVNVEIRNCLAINNEGTGFYASLSRLDATSEPVSLKFVNCRVLNARQSGMRAFLKGDIEPRGLVEYIGCTFEGTDYAGAMIAWNTTAPIKLRFQDCKWRAASRRSGQPPVDLQLFPSDPERLGGGIEFENCYVYDDKERNPVRFVDPMNIGSSDAVSGKIHLINSEINTTGRFGAEDLPRLSVEHQRRQR